MTDSILQITADDYTTSLRQQAHEDLTMRARGGIFIYLVVWLITAIWADIVHSAPLFFYLNTFLFLVVSLLRTVHYFILRKYVDSNAARMYRWLVAMILFSAFHWGILSAWVIFGSQYEVLHYPYMIIIAAFAIGGTAVLSISRTISICFPLFIFAPSIIIGLITGGAGGENLVLVILAIFSIFYVLEASRVSRKDYWDAIYNHKVAEERARQMELLSITDQLTGLNNRMYFSSRFSTEWKRCDRDGQSLSVMLIDLDHFKRINDTYGHVAGDECLKKVGAVLKSEIRRETDIVARYGGEEFVVILPDADIASTTQYADRLLRAISRITLIWDGQTIAVSCSIGLACTIPDQQTDSQVLLIAADNALYQAKEQGRNQYTIANELPFSETA